MKHGVAFRKFSRTSSHRMLMLRNLVTSLFEHEQIKTTLPKARDTARLAEKIITLGKKGDNNSYNKASAFLLKPAALTKLCTTFASRYAERPGGYTRIHKFGNRFGDNAPQAIVELVDNPRDLRWEMTARAAGWDILKYRLFGERHQDGSSRLLKHGATRALSILELEPRDPNYKAAGLLRSKTRWNVQKVLKFRGEDAIKELAEKVEAHADKLLAAPLTYRAAFEDVKEGKPATPQPRRFAGYKRIGEERPALEIARGTLGSDAQQSTRRNRVVYSTENALTRGYKLP